MLVAPSPTSRGGGDLGGTGFCAVLWAGLQLYLNHCAVVALFAMHRQYRSLHMEGSIVEGGVLSSFGCASGEDR